MRPALASDDAIEADFAVIGVWPELKPDALSAIKEAAGPPRPSSSRRVPEPEPDARLSRG